MQFEFLFYPFRPEVPRADASPVEAPSVPLLLVQSARARRYILRVTPDGAARVTIPRGGSIVEARRFAERHLAWIARQLQKRAAEARRPKGWFLGSSILFRGETVILSSDLGAEAGSAGTTPLETPSAVQAGGAGVIRFADQAVRVPDVRADLRPRIGAHLWCLAAAELPGRVLELATPHQLPVRRVTVRNQRSRWGSCSRRGTISLNWRLIQTASWVRDYLILHELMHLREMNHSDRFWLAVEQVCPQYRAAERWLSEHRELLHG